MKKTIKKIIARECLLSIILASGSIILCLVFIVVIRSLGYYHDEPAYWAAPNKIPYGLSDLWNRFIPSERSDNLWGKFMDGRLDLLDKFTFTIAVTWAIAFPLRYIYLIAQWSIKTMKQEQQTEEYTEDKTIGNQSK